MRGYLSYVKNIPNNFLTTSPFANFIKSTANQSYIISLAKI